MNLEIKRELDDVTLSTTFPLGRSGGGVGEIRGRSLSHLWYLGTKE